MKCKMSWNVKCYEIANVMKCQMPWNVKCHEMSNVKCHEMSNVMKCQESWNVKCHEMSDVMKCKMSLNADADAGSMTPSRNTRRYTLRSIPSSPGRSFFIRFRSMYLKSSTISQTTLQYIARVFHVAYMLFIMNMSFLWDLTSSFGLTDF